MLEIKYLSRCSFRLILLSMVGPALVMFGCQRSTQGLDNGPVSTKRQAIRCANGLTTEELVLNAIATNRLALVELTSNALETGTFASGGPAPELHFGLHHDRARRYMTYLVQCALPESAPLLEYEDPFTLITYSFRGGLNLCSEWIDGPFPVSLECRERVSGCLLARNNPEGRRVPLSMRGIYPDHPEVFALLPRIITDPHEPLTHERVVSFEPCDPPALGADRSCGWSSAWVGRCDPGTSVFVSAGAPRLDACDDPDPPLLGSSTGLAVLQACDGIFGCNPDSDRYLASAEPFSCPLYPGPALSFPCPDSGNFSVMSGPYDSATSDTAEPDAAGDAVDYPAPEERVYPQVEGAFYGDVFDPAAINPHVMDVGVNPQTGEVTGDNQVIPIELGPIFTAMWACHARQWTEASAYLTHRFCALPDANCAASSTGVCFDPAGSSQCSGEDGAEMNAFEPPCLDVPDEPWMWPVTTYLNQPCDALPSGSEAYCAVSGTAPLADRRTGASRSRSVRQGLQVLPDGSEGGACELE